MSKKPDTLGDIINFGCGSFLGFFTALVILSSSFINIEHKFIVIACLLNAVIVGRLAMKMKDRFWHNLKDWL
jgi:hypothetical protein